MIVKTKTTERLWRKADTPAMKLFRRLQRFADKISRESPSSCWLWVGAKDRDGYGIFGGQRKRVYAHRFAYELLIGSIPEGLTLDHLCQNPACVNPDHLEPVTPTVNLFRGLLSKGLIEGWLQQELARVEFSPIR